MGGAGGHLLGPLHSVLNVLRADSGFGLSRTPRRENGPVIGLTSGVIWAESTFRKGQKGKAVFTSVSLKDEWDRLDSKTRTWLLENPASLVLPHAMSVKFSRDAHGPISCDSHGQVVLSRDDRDFIREKAEAAGTIRVPEREYRFFDTSPLPVIGKSPHGMRATASPDAAQ